ncbi:hypothetical protein A3E49_02965 [Candidatus Saccharibacteria bacterium RIFCSPHIGHO2_12_FULL_49_19]|nr:MAG: hypothetical protein A3E49_02965 [Candidatus Saccharibacteria bacterium RIFCSPHIGHO2_12_FULL_49_19]
MPIEIGLRAEGEPGIGAIWLVSPGSPRYFTNECNYRKLYRVACVTGTNIGMFLFLDELKVPFMGDPTEFLRSNMLDSIDKAVTTVIKPGGTHEHEGVFGAEGKVGEPVLRHIQPELN